MSIPNPAHPNLTLTIIHYLYQPPLGALPIYASGLISQGIPKKEDQHGSGQPIQLSRCFALERDVRCKRRAANFENRNEGEAHNQKNL